MSSEGRGRDARRAEAAALTPALHARPFKLRFAPQRQLGRSYVSATKPLGLPAIIKIKLDDTEEPAGGEQDAAGRVRALFARGPREKHTHPLTTSHEYGWWAAADARAAGPRHHIRDSQWMKERLRVLAADAGFKRL